MTLGSAWSRTWGEACRQQGLWHTEGRRWHHRDDLQEQQQDQLAALQWEAEREEAISSVRCLRCHYTPDACLCTWLIINRVRAAAGGGDTARPARSVQCLLPEVIPSPSTALPAAAPTDCDRAARQPLEQGIPHPTELLCHQPGTTHVHNNASLFSPADFRLVPFFSSSLLLALPYAIRSK